VIASRVHVREIGGDEWTGVIDVAEFPAPLRAALYRLAAPVVAEACFGTRHMAVPFPGDDPFEGLRRALAAAWQPHADQARDVDVVVHGVLDLWALTGRPLPDHLRGDACARLATRAPSAARDRLAERFGVHITPRA
jgi:hypothetical protein